MFNYILILYGKYAFSSSSNKYLLNAVDCTAHPKTKTAVKTDGGLFFITAGFMLCQPNVYSYSNVL